ncbi:MAG TPA: hypothetical protein VFS43_16325 [Polyangiaceae bacterium]|nr:hypothetical protein [Polyangiaceae bacterium]
MSAGRAGPAGALGLALSALGCAPAAALGLALSALGCAPAPPEGEPGTRRQEARALDRYLLGQAAPYPADPPVKGRAEALSASMALRRQAAWAVVEKVVAPVPIATADALGETITLPRFHTWYSRDDFLPMFDQLFRSLPDADKIARAPFGDERIARIFPWNVVRATRLPTFSPAKLEERRRELELPGGPSSLGGDGRALLSPAYVAHVLRSYRPLVECEAPPPAEGGAFAPCLEGEFPPDAVAVKTRWVTSASPLPTYDTSAGALAAKLAGGTFGPGDGEADPGPDAIYTMRLAPGLSTRLVALHIMTKELRDWFWITLFWSDQPNSDFGADRPARLAAGPFRNYKMCVTTAFEEHDPAPGAAFEAEHPSLAAALSAAAAHGPSTWCSNPYLETAEHAARTNCIGCHQHGGTDETTDTILQNPAAFPDAGRTKVRANFPVDYAFSTHGGLDLAAEMLARIEALTPPPPGPEPRSPAGADGTFAAPD